ncbi:hypothetical protein EJ04DRAFT_493222 [Polyplosphaeria fusca]|uniref:R3H-associated N-terminal domain-containing protein n=1 Tax=Polyplosphaeria fusca TaxID=682080 RepID=A0A9P4R0H2_9PLEO|nr:hypothetical protein EJ04DRAFT_493222 [Polyplosphaeria fusca]
MAIHPTPDPAPQHAAAIDIETWTEQATIAISTLTISAPPAIQSSGVSLQIPLDEHPPSTSAPAKPGFSTTTTTTSYTPRKPPLRRDSLKRRDALLKGKEGSRRRQRYENAHLLTNPHATPPTPSDWAPHPTHRVTHVPYYLAPLWDAGLAKRSAERRAAAGKSGGAGRGKGEGKKGEEAGIVPRELREKLKKRRGAVGLLMDLEESVREWVGAGMEGDDGLPGDDEIDSSDEEIVFVGREGRMRDIDDDDRDSRRGEGKQELLLFETEEGDRGGAFGRWLVHHIGVYYGLRTWSVTTGGEPKRREAYVGFGEKGRGGGKRRGVCSPMPRPLWGMM